MATSHSKKKPDLSSQGGGKVSDKCLPFYPANLNNLSNEISEDILNEITYKILRQTSPKTIESTPWIISARIGALRGEE